MANEIDWAGWAQAATGVIALLAVPTSIKTIWTRLRYRFEAVCIPDVLDGSGGGTHWTISIKNRSMAMRPLDVLIYPKRPRNLVAFASVDTPNDGGILVSKSDSSSGSLEIRAERIARDRTIDIRVVFNAPDIPELHSSVHNLTTSINFNNQHGRIIRNGHIATGHTRLMMLMLQFAAVTAFIIIRLGIIATQK